MVSVDDLYSFTYREVRARTPDQTPGKVDMVRGSLYLAANPRIQQPAFSSPSDPFTAVTSERRAREREEAALSLRAFAEDPNADVAKAAQLALERLSADRERLVRASALAALGDLALSDFERGLVFANSGDPAGADAEFQKVAESAAVELIPLAHFNRGILAIKTESTNDAIQHFTLALESGQTAVVTRSALNLGCFPHAIGRLEDAANMYRMAMSYGDEAVEPRAAFLLACIEERRGNLSTAWLNYAIAADYEDSPFAAAAKSHHRTLILYAQPRDIFVRLLRLAGYPNPSEIADSIYGKTQPEQRRNSGG